MTTTEELLARIERLEEVVYDEIEYPKISKEREPASIKARYEESGVKILKEPPKAPISDIKFDERFLVGMEYRRAISAFRRHKHGDAGAIFYVRSGGNHNKYTEPVIFEIVSVEKMNLKTFISLYWEQGGFANIDDACRYFTNTYAEPARPSEILDFNTIEGYVHKIRRFENDDD